MKPINSRDRTLTPQEQLLERTTFLLTGTDGKPVKTLSQATNEELSVMRVKADQQQRKAQEEAEAVLGEKLGAMVQAARMQGAVQFEFERRREGGAVITDKL
jgi:hypothetical protein